LADIALATVKAMSPNQGTQTKEQPMLFWIALSLIILTAIIVSHGDIWRPAQ